MKEISYIYNISKKIHIMMLIAKEKFRDEIFTKFSCLFDKESMSLEYVSWRKPKSMILCNNCKQKN